MCLFKWITGLVSENPLDKLGQKQLFLIRSEILGLLLKTLRGNYEYSRSNRDNLVLPFQLNLSQKP